jgi:hypothetical protein
VSGGAKTTCNHAKRGPCNQIEVWYQHSYQQG